MRKRSVFKYLLFLLTSICSCWSKIEPNLGWTNVVTISTSFFCSHIRFSKSRVGRKFCLFEFCDCHLVRRSASFCSVKVSVPKAFRLGFINQVNRISISTLKEGNLLIIKRKRIFTYWIIFFLPKLIHYFFSICLYWL